MPGTDPATRENKALKRLTHAKNNPLEKAKRWRKPGKTVADEREDRFRITLDADVDMESAEFKAFEKHVTGMNIEVVSKTSNRFGRVVVVEGSPDKIRGLKATHDHIVDVIAPAPVARFGSSTQTILYQEAEAGTSCSASDARRQVSVMDTVGGELPEVRANHGQGAIVIVWDSFFYSNATEYTERPGGAPIYAHADDKGSTHGGYVASTCCGAAAGLADGAQLVVIGTGMSTEEGLGLINDIVQSERALPLKDQSAIVVNMSFGFEYKGPNYRMDRDDAKETTMAWDNAMMQMVEEYPRLIFVNASGNYGYQGGYDGCDETYGGSFGDYCQDCYIWPTFAHGPSRYGIDKEALVRVGAVHGTQASVPAERERAGYSTGRMCVPVYSHGLVCAFDVQANGFRTIAGTSFSAPMFSSLLALVMTKWPTMSGREATKYLINHGERMKEADGGSFARATPELFALDASSAAGGSGSVLGVVAASEGADSKLSAPPWTTFKKATLGMGIVFGVLVLLLLAIFARDRYKRLGKKIKVYPGDVVREEQERGW
jgi:hypothetical protein